MCLGRLFVYRRRQSLTGMVPGPWAVFRERGVGVYSPRRAAHVRRDQTFVFLRDSTGAVVSTSRGVYHLRCPCPEVSVHFIIFRISISGELRTIDSCPEACTFVTNLAGHSAIVKREKRNQQVLPQTKGAFLSRLCRTCIGPATQILIPKTIGNRKRDCA